MGKIPKVQYPEACLSLEDIPLLRSRLSTLKKRKRDPATFRKSPPRKKVVTPVEEETWDKDPVEIELSYPEPDFPVHIQGVIFSSQEKLPPVNEEKNRS